MQVKSTSSFVRSIWFTFILNFNIIKFQKFCFLIVLNNCQKIETENRIVNLGSSV